MSAIVEVDKQIIKESVERESQRLELENLRKLGILQVRRFEGRDDEDCEQQFLEFFSVGDNETLYVSEPGMDRA